MTLGGRQELFMRLLPSLINKAHELGFEIRGGDLFRDPRLHGGIGRRNLVRYLETIISVFNLNKVKEEGYKGYGSKTSEHKNKCAIDLNLRKPDVGMLWSTEDHRELGEWWEEQHPYCRWGGRYNDGNHYELLKWR